MTKEILLTRGLVALVGDEDYEELNQYKWSAIKTRSTCYATRAYHFSKNKQKHIYMHRQILGLTDPKILTDHINHNGLDNRRENLRPVTNQQNHWNSLPKKGYKGVQNINFRWASSIKHDGKLIHLGVFGTPEEAAKAYNKAAIEYFGEYANLNVITKPYYPNRNTKQWREVLSLRSKGLHLDQVGIIAGITKQRVHQIINQAKAYTTRHDDELSEWIKENTK